MKLSSIVSYQKTLLVLCLICCITLTVSAANYYPSEIGNTWVFLSADGGEKLTYTIEPPKDTDVEGLIVLKITNEAIGADLATSTDLYDITVENDGSLLLHHSLTDEGAFGFADVTYDPPVTFFPAELPLGHTWQIMAETELQLVGEVSSTTTITVVAIEDVETAAGVFKDCVKLEIKQKDITAIAVLRKTSYQWLASDIGPVKFLSEDQDVVYELQDYNLLEPKTETPMTDVNGDGKVDILDLVSVASNFGKPVSDENANVDVNNDGEINILDLVQIAQDFGE